MSPSPFKPPQPLPAQDVENLRLVCDELGLSPDALEQLLFAARHIRFMEAGQEWKSAPVRRRELLRVAELAKMLNDALQCLDYTEKSALHLGFKDASIRMQLDPPDPLRSVFFGAALGEIFEDANGDYMRDIACENVLLVGDVLLTLEAFAVGTVQHIQGQETGRRPRNDQLARYIRDVAWCAHSCGIAIGRGGPFQRLCEAVFLAGGISTDPEAAIRKFVADHLPVYLEIWQAEQADDEDTG